MKRSILLIVLLVSVMGCNSLKNVDDLGSLDCTTYCNMMEDNCDLVYQGNREACLDDCSQYEDVPQFDEDGNEIPLGERVDGDDSFECRIYHLETALLGLPNNPHCEEASAPGGGTCVFPDVDPECAVLCHGAVYGCNLTLEDYQNCEFDCEDATIIERDSPEYRCRQTLSNRARQTKNDGNADPTRTICGVTRDVFVGEADCVETASGVLPGGLPM